MELLSSLLHTFVLGPFWALFLAYSYSLTALFLLGLTLVLLDRDWGPVAELYLKAVAWVQDCLIKLHDTPNTLHIHSSPTKLIWDFFSTSSSCTTDQQEAEEDMTGTETDDSDENGGGGDQQLLEGLSTGSTTSSDGSFELVAYPLQSPAMAPFELAIELCGQGIESIVKEDVGAGFRLAPDYRRYELNPFRIPRRKMSVQPKPDEHHRWVRRVFRRIHHRVRPPHRPRHTPKQRLLLFLLFCTSSFRLCMLFPVRLVFLLASCAFLFVCYLWNAFRPMGSLMKTRCAVIYCRLYILGCGFITRFHGTENRPKRPGVICANHLSPNDVHVIFGDIPAERDYLYMVTGQKHRGFIWMLENLVDKMCPAIWLERSDPESRREFSIQILEAAKNSGPVILFPEGYCTNNSYVLMFRRAVFQEGVTVYPVAIRQEPRFGDAYWSENNFMHYLFRVLTSWAIVYNIYYLTPQHRLPDEDATKFAARVQQLIASKVGVRTVDYDGGGLWYKFADREKAKGEWLKRSALELVDRLLRADRTGEMDSDAENSGNTAPITADAPEIVDDGGEPSDHNKRPQLSRKFCSLPAPTRPSAAMENLIQQSPASGDNQQQQQTPRNRRRAASEGGSDSDEMDLIG